MLAQWPNSAEENFIKQMQELHLELPPEFKDLSPADATQQVIAMVQTHRVPGIFRPVTISPTAKQNIQWRNDNTPSNRKQFRMDHIPEVFMGAVAPWDPPHTPVLTPKEVGDMIALCTIIQRQQLSLL